VADQWVKRPAGHGETPWHRISKVFEDGSYLCGCGRTVPAGSPTARGPRGRICAGCEDAPDPGAIHDGAAAVLSTGFGNARR